MSDVLPVPGQEPSARARHPALGYAMALSAAFLFGVNGTVSKVALEGGLSEYRLAEARVAAAFVVFVAIVLAARRERLRTTPRELAYLAVFGACAVVLTQLLYLLAIRRLEIGIALVLIFLGPLLVALWARLVEKERVRRRFWTALALSLVGLVLVVRVWGSFSLDGLGVLFALADAAAYAAYVLYAEHAVGRRDPLTLLCYGFLFAVLVWSVVQPWWSFPGHALTARVSLLGNLTGSHVPEWALVAWIVVLGTVVPFVLVVGSLRHLPATRVAICGMLEPVVATVVAFAWLDESLGPAQLAGGAVVLAAIALAQTAR